MELDREQRLQFREALLSAFREPEHLRQMIEDRLEGNVNAEISGDTLLALVADLIRWAEAQGRVEEVIQAAFAAQPGNALLSAFTDRLHLHTPYLADYQWDVWISAADDVDADWLVRLRSDLRARLVRKLKQDVTVAGGAPAAVAEREPSGMATFVVVLSPGYPACARCDREREAFFHAHGAGARETRIFLAEYEPAESGALPETLRGLPVHRFSAGEERYFASLEDLRNRLAETLLRLKEGPIPTGDRKRVFLAEAPEEEELELHREEVRRYLEQQGFQVLPEAYYPRDPAAFQQRLDRDLDQCDAFVQLLGRRPWRRTEDLPRGYVGLQLERAQASRKPILQWRSPGTKPESVPDPEYREFLNGSRVREEGIEVFKSAIVEEIRRQVPLPPGTANDLGALVFVDTDPVDRDWAERTVCRSLVDRGFGYALPLPPTEPREEYERFLEANLRHCDALFVVYGSASQSWVFEQLMKLKEALGRRERPLRGFALSYAPPPRPRKLSFMLPKLEFLDLQQDTTPLLKYLERLAAGGPS